MTVTFKAGSKVEHDVNWVSYVKDAGGSFGAIGDAAMQLDDAHKGSSIIYQTMTYEGVCLLAVVCLTLYFCRRGARQNKEGGLPRWQRLA